MADQVKFLTGKRLKASGVWNDLRKYVVALERYSAGGFLGGTAD
jgi:hypothetical protein